MKLTIIIQGREAIPVRAIPFVTGWGGHNFTLDPHSLVAHLATGKFIVGFTADYPLTAYYFPLDGPLSEIRRDNWKIYEKNLLDIQSQCEDERCRYEQWRQRAILELPSGVFLWKDEFEQFWYKDFLPRISMQPPTDDELREEYEINEPPYSDERERICNRLDFMKSQKQEFGNLMHPPPILDYDPYCSSEFAGLVLYGFTNSLKDSYSDSVKCLSGKDQDALYIGTRGRPSDQRIAERNDRWILQAKSLRSEKRSWSNKKIAEKIKGMKILNQDGLSVLTILEVISPYITKK
ncbi:MAG: hypothetical protein HQL77_18495 [Magnetococcales bacterium]|nr:hypothetical protein [Magnetococcales bacterium]